MPHPLQKLGLTAFGMAVGCIFHDPPQKCESGETGVLRDIPADAQGKFKRWLNDAVELTGCVYPEKVTMDEPFVVIHSPSSDPLEYRGEPRPDFQEVLEAFGQANGTDYRLYQSMKPLGGGFTSDGTYLTLTQESYHDLAKQVLSGLINRRRAAAMYFRDPADYEKSLSDPNGFVARLVQNITHFTRFSPQEIEELMVEMRTSDNYRFRAILEKAVGQGSRQHSQAASSQISP